MKKIFIALFILGQFSSCTQNQGETNESQGLTLFAAASLANVMEELIETFENTTEGKVKVNYASSGTLARQIEQGASADLFISANRAWYDYLDERGYFQRGGKKTLAKNQLVLIGPAGQVHSFDSLNLKDLPFNKILKGKRLAMGNPKHVPAGLYALAALKSLALYDEIKSQIIPTKDVRSALRLVELEEAPLGIVYRTDALASGKVKILATFSDDHHPPIEYLAGRLAKTSISDKFWSFLNSEASKTIWKKYGFLD